MGNLSSIIRWLTDLQDKTVNIQLIGETGYDQYKVYNVHTDGYLEAISSDDNDDETVSNFVHMIPVSQIKNICIDIEDTDIDLEEDE